MAHFVSLCFLPVPLSQASQQLTVTTHFGGGTALATSHSRLMFLQSQLCHGSSSTGRGVPKVMGWAGRLNELGFSSLVLAEREIILNLFGSCCFSFFLLLFPETGIETCCLLLKTSNILIAVSCLSVSLPTNAICCLVSISNREVGREADGKRKTI